MTLSLFVIILSAVLATGTVARGQGEDSSQGSASVNLLINYGNGTLEWHNNTLVPINWNFYNVTAFVTDGNLAAIFFSAFQSHFVYRINGAGCPDSNPFCELAWSLWILNGVCWKTSDTGPDLIPVSEGKTVAWFLVPVDAFGQNPPTGVHCLNVDIDIKPGTDPNTINVRSRGLIPVTILTTQTFDATAVDPATVRFGRTGGEAAPARTVFEDVDGDGDTDAVQHFKNKATGIQPGDREAFLTGRILNGTPFIGHDEILVIASQAVSIPSFSSASDVSAVSRTDAIDSALNWLITRQQADGSYGSLTELQTAPAAYSLWIRNRDASNVVLAYTWLKNRMMNSTTWFWSSSFGEADVPGEILYSFAVSQHLAMLNISLVVSRLLSFQQSNGGFKGYNPSGQPTTSSVDTAMALWGLINTQAIPAQNQQSAIDYLFSLQNPDGSFKLTVTVSSDPLYSLGPDPVSITALVLLVLEDAGYTANDPQVSSALNYLSNAASNNFNGHVYAAALSALAFTGYSRSDEIDKAITFIMSSQNSDGGFRDIIRFSASSNALDTGWAAIALQLAGLSGGCIGGGGGGRVMVL